MYHPDHMLRIGHDREAELVREAQACGVGQRAAGQNRLFGRILAAGLGLMTLGTVLALLMS